MKFYDRLAPKAGLGRFARTAVFGTRESMYYGKAAIGMLRESLWKGRSF